MLCVRLKLPSGACQHLQTIIFLLGQEICLIQLIQIDSSKIAVFVCHHQARLPHSASGCWHFDEGYH